MTEKEEFNNTFCQVQRRLAELINGPCLSAGYGTIWHLLEMEGLRIPRVIDLFGLYILFSQYRSCDNTQEVWSFVLFIKMRACKHEYACMHSF